MAQPYSLRILHCVMLMCSNPPLAKRVTHKNNANMCFSHCGSTGNNKDGYCLCGKSETEQQRMNSIYKGHTKMDLLQGPEKTLSKNSWYKCNYNKNVHIQNVNILIEEILKQ